MSSLRQTSYLLASLITIFNKSWNVIVLRFKVTDSLRERCEISTREFENNLLNQTYTASYLLKYLFSNFRETNT